MSKKNISNDDLDGKLNDLIKVLDLNALNTKNLSFTFSNILELMNNDNRHNDSLYNQLNDVILNITNNISLVSEKLDTMNNISIDRTASNDKLKTYIPQKNYHDNEGKILVIMASYNAESTIEFAANSILNQTYKNINLCIVDDNSTDDTVKIIEELYGDNERVHIFKLNENHGSYIARNVALRECVSDYDYWTLHDADDFAYPNRYTDLMSILKQSDKLVVNCGFVRKDIKTKEVLKTKENSENSVIYHKDVFTKLGFYDERTRYGGDTEYRNRFYAAFDRKNLLQSKKILFDAFVTGFNCTSINKPDSDLRKDYAKLFNSEISEFKKTQSFFRNFTLSSDEYIKIK